MGDKTDITVVCARVVKSALLPRAMVGNLQFEGYKSLPNIMVHRNSHYIRLVSLANQQPTTNPPYMPPLNHFSHGGKNLVL